MNNPFGKIHCFGFVRHNEKSSIITAEKFNTSLSKVLLIMEFNKESVYLVLNNELDFVRHQMHCIMSHLIF